MLDFGLNLYLLAEHQSQEAWNSQDLNYKARCYDRAERLQAIANIMGFKDSHWQDFKAYRAEMDNIDPRVVNY